MSKLLKITGTVFFKGPGKDAEREIIHNTTIDLDKDKRLSKADVDRILRSGSGVMLEEKPPEPKTTVKKGG